MCGTGGPWGEDGYKGTRSGGWVADTRWCGLGRIGFPGWPWSAAAARCRWPEWGAQVRGSGARGEGLGLRRREWIDKSGAEWVEIGVPPTRWRLHGRAVSHGVPALSHKPPEKDIAAKKPFSFSMGAKNKTRGAIYSSKKMRKDL